MTSTAGRKKSIVSTAGLVIDTPVANNSALNKSASQSTSLHQQCSALRARLLRVKGFEPFFALASSVDSRQSTDPVTQLWDLFSLGIPLVYIYNLLPPPLTKIGADWSVDTFDVSNERAKKRAIALFAMQMANIEGCERFTVTDLWDHHSTDGLVKVINNVTQIVDRLPTETFEEPPPSPPSISTHESTDSLPTEASIANIPVDSRETARNNIVREMMETERKYVQDLEIMQKYSTALSRNNAVDQDTIHYLFPNLNKLLNFQRKFLIRMEGIAELPWQEQRWGSIFISCEPEFVVYEPYCANYTKATELMLANEHILMEISHTINMTAMKGELPAFLIKPIQRVCKYPLLLESLVKATTPEDYSHRDELQEGLLAAKRIADKINEAQRRSENDQTVKILHSRVEDWKGHHLSNFGDLLLDDIFLVTKSEVDREYHVFLFEKIILCCKEALPALNSSKKVSKSNSILKKQQGSPALGGTPPTPFAKKNSPLLLKGRIFLNNVTQAVPGPPTGSPPQYPLAVWWRGDDDLEFFTLRCRSQEAMKQWETQINRLIKEASARRIPDRSAGLSRIAAYSNSTNPAFGRQSSASVLQERGLYPTSYATQSQQASRRTNYGNGEGMSPSVAPGELFNTGGPQGYPSHGGFEADEDEYVDYPPTSNYPPSGRGTPTGTRRMNAQSMPMERQDIPTNDRPRTLTEDRNGPTMSQWRPNGVGITPTPSVRSGTSTVRSIAPRLPSSYSSAAQDSSYGGSSQRPPLRSQFSSTRLKNNYDTDSRSHSPASAAQANGVHPTNRSRSASQPSAYLPKAIPPPLPSSQWQPPPHGSTKRGSGSSESTGGSSDYSPNSSSPITPFGSSESSIGGVGIRASRSQNFEGVANGAGHMHITPPVKVKVHFNEDIFVIQVSRSTEYEDLVEKVGRKIRLCGPRRDDGPLRVKYRDEDGDMVSLGSTEDVQMAFEQYQPGGQVTLFVT